MSLLRLTREDFKLNLATCKEGFIVRPDFILLVAELKHSSRIDQRWLLPGVSLHPYDDNSGRTLVMLTNEYERFDALADWIAEATL